MSEATQTRCSKLAPVWGRGGLCGVPGFGFWGGVRRGGGERGLGGALLICCGGVGLLLCSCSTVFVWRL